MNVPSSRLLPAALLCCLVALMPMPALTDSNAEANRLLVEAVRLYRQAQIMPRDERYSVYRQVKARLDRIVEEHPSSDLAVKIVLGERLGPIDQTALTMPPTAPNPPRLTSPIRPGFKRAVVGTGQSLSRISIKKYFVYNGSRADEKLTAIIQIKLDKLGRFVESPELISSSGGEAGSQDALWQAGRRALLKAEGAGEFAKHPWPTYTGPIHITFTPTNIHIGPTNGAMN